MALDPSIALGYRPPQVNVEVPHPLQQFGQILSLRNMMQQGQLFPLELQAKELALKQAQLAYQQDLGLANMFTHPEAGTAPAPLVAPVTPTIPPSGLTGGPESVPGLPNVGALPVLPPAPSAAAAAPAAPALPAGGIPGGLSWQKMIEVGGARAFPWIKNINEAQSAQLDREKKQLDLAKGQSEDMVRLANGMTTNEFKNKLLPEAVAKGYIPGDLARQYYAMDVNDPRFQAQKESWGQQALTYDKSVELGIKRNEEARNQSEEVRKWTEFHNKQFDQEVSDFKAKVGTLTDASQFGPLLAAGSDRLKTMFGRLVGQPLNDIKLWTGAGKPDETVPKPTAVTDAEAAAGAKKTAAETTSRIAAEDAQYVPLAKRFLNKEIRWDQLSSKEQDAVGRIITPPGSERTTKLSDTESTHLTNMQTGLDQVRDLRKELTGAKFLMTGPWADILKDSVVGAKWQGLQGRLGMLQATVGDLIKGGVLRAADQKIYQDMFPKLEDSPWTVREKLTNLENKLTNDLGRYKDSLRAQSRFIPGETPPATPAGAGAAPAASQPQYQTIEKTGVAGPKVTGTFRIGSSGEVPQGVRAGLAGKPSGTYQLRNKTTGQVERWFVDSNGNPSQIP